MAKNHGFTALQSAKVGKWDIRIHIEILGYLSISLILEYELLSDNLIAKNRGFTALQSAKVAIVDS